MIGAALIGWAWSQGLLPVPAAAGEFTSVDVSIVVVHPFISAALTATCGAALVLVVRMLRARARPLLTRLRLGLTILERPREYLLGVVTWQVLARAIRLCSLACFLAAFALPVTLATVVLVMAAQSGGGWGHLDPNSGPNSLRMPGGRSAPRERTGGFAGLS